MSAFSLIKHLQEINQVISQDLQLGFDISHQPQTESTFTPVSLPILIPYQSEVMLNQILIKKMIERFVRGYIELQQETGTKKPMSRNYLKGLIQLSYWEPELSDTKLSVFMKEIGKIIRDTGELSQEQYKELTNGIIVFEINNYSSFKQKLALNQAGRRIQDKIATIQTLIENHFQKNYQAFNTSSPIK